MVDVLLGLQWGDEGKGKIVDFLAPNYNIIARFQGGPNAGHTLYVNNKKIVLHTVPSGIFHPQLMNFIGNGVVIDPITLKLECEEIIAEGADLKNKMVISDKAHIILPTHRALDKASELAKGKDKIGSTLKGIGPAYMDKTGRNGIRVGDVFSPRFQEKYQALKAKHLIILEQMGFNEDISSFEQGFDEAIEYLLTLKMVNGVYWLNNQLSEGKSVLAEGAQGTMLDVDFGTYPFVTSSNTVTAGVCTGLGIAPQHIKEVIGITKAYCTRVGSGPFPTELTNENGDNLRKIGNEFGATTGRPRRCGWIDLVALKYACMINGVTQLCITKADILDNFDTISVCEAYEIDGVKTKIFPYDLCVGEVKPVWFELAGWGRPTADCRNESDLPLEFKLYISYLNSALKTRIKYVSNGPQRESIIVLRS